MKFRLDFSALLLFGLAIGCGETGTNAVQDAEGHSDAQADRDGARMDAGTDALTDGGAVTCLENQKTPPFDLSLPGAGGNGVFDPDMEFDPETERLWMAYSTVDGPPGNGKVSTHLSYSDDHGLTWCGGFVVNQSNDVATEDLPAGVTGSSAHWNNETATLVREPGASADKRWRLVWHRYLVVADGDADPSNDRRFMYGWLAQRQAATPEGLVEAPERKLFSGAAYYANASIQAYNDAAPGGLPEMDWRSDPTLGSCLIFGEPGAIGTVSGLEMTSFCARSATDTAVVLVSFDESGQSWTYRSTLLGPTEAKTFDPSYRGFNGVGLFPLDNDRVGLTATPTAENEYKGCVIFTLDLATGTLVDQDHDGPDVLFLLGPSTTPSVFHSGACDYNLANSSGLLVSEAHQTGVVFRIRATGTNL
ncbi:MAG: hypothetical protein J7M25_16970 [Deltaproteobacteria bacterium]|nr:hypothetical protein [Deltaproteobacteria bacterium]